MPLISVSEELAVKSFTSVENKFITKYLPVLQPDAVKVYLYSLYLYQSGMTSVTFEDMANALSLSNEELKGYFEYLEEFELISIISVSPFEIKIQDAENLYGKPKKFKPEKYADFTKSVQNIIKGRMISTNEFREYFYLLEEYGFEQNALIMIINYCVNLKGDNIRLQYIKKVAKSFADEGAVTAAKVDSKLCAYTSSTPALLRIFSAAGINKKPDIDDDKAYKKWTQELGYEENTIISIAKYFKVKTIEKLDDAVCELYKNKKFDEKEIEDYCKNKNSAHNAAIDIARSLGVYMQNSAPYIENYVNVWYNFGYTFECMKLIANYCFMHGKNSFDEMDGFVRSLYNEGIVDEKSVQSFIEKQINDEKFIKNILSLCGLTRKVIDWDRDSLKKWRSWNFSDEMINEAAKLSVGKSNPVAYINGILSSWKSDGVFSTDKLNNSTVQSTTVSSDGRTKKAEIERHFYDLRHKAEIAAETALNRATADETYGNIYRKLKELSIQLAFAEIRDENAAKTLSLKIKELELQGDKRLKELKIDKSDFTPRYSCKLCNDTGYDENGNPCECMKEFIKTL